MPDEYFLRDTTGRKIEVWPGAYRLNLTRPEVAEYQARYAYQRMLESGLMLDGCFFDNFMMSQSWLTHDIYDRPVQLDADGSGKAATTRTNSTRPGARACSGNCGSGASSCPGPLTTGHSQGYPYPEIAEIFNGQGIGFYTTDVIEGQAVVPRPLGLLQRVVYADRQAGNHFGGIGGAQPDRLRLRLQPAAAHPAVNLGLRTRLLPLYAVRAGLHPDGRRLLQPRAGRHGPRPGLVVRRVGLQARRAPGRGAADRSPPRRGPRIAGERGFRERVGGDLAALVRSEERLRGDGPARHRRQACRVGRGMHHDHGRRPPWGHRAQPIPPLAGAREGL